MNAKIKKITKKAKPILVATSVVAGVATVAYLTHKFDVSKQVKPSDFINNWIDEMSGYGFTVYALDSKQEKIYQTALAVSQK